MYENSVGNKQDDNNQQLLVQPVGGSLLEKLHHIRWITWNKVTMRVLVGQQKG